MRQALLHRRRRSVRRGATTVEFALVAPVFFLILFGSFEFGRLNMIRHTAEEAAYEAARAVIVPGATAADATNTAQQIMRIVGARGTVVTVVPATIDASTTEVTVSVSIPMNQNGYIVPRFSRNRTIVRSSRLQTERLTGI